MRNYATRRAIESFTRFYAFNAVDGALGDEAEQTDICCDTLTAL